MTPKYFLITLTLILFIHRSASNKGRSVRSSSYKTPTGGFLLDQPENPDALFDHHGTPQHFTELKSIHKIKDRIKREAVLNERTVRVPRSPQIQFTANAQIGSGAEENSQRDPKSASISAPSKVTLEPPSFFAKSDSTIGVGVQLNSSSEVTFEAPSFFATSDSKIGVDVQLNSSSEKFNSNDKKDASANLDQVLNFSGVAQVDNDKPILNVTTSLPKIATLPPTSTPGMNVDLHGKPGELLLPENYHNLQIPKPDYGKSIGEYLPGPLICLLFVKILGISEINEIESTITFDADFTVEWIDGLIFDVSQALDRNPPSVKEVLKAQKTLSPAFLKKLWRPDLFMEDLVKVEQPTITDKAVISLKFNKLEGFISYTVRMSITVNCPMSFEHFPADTQRCVFRIASYSHTKDDMSLDWLVLDSKHTGVILDDDSEDNFDIKLDKIEKYEYKPRWNNPANNSYEVLTFSLGARRKISYHLIQTYLPSVFNIFVTWLVFLIPYALYDCRIGTTMTTLLTLTAMFSAVREQSPQVNYIKAIDLWMLACVLFIFLNLVELSVMTWMRITIETYEEAKDKADDMEAGPGKDAEIAEHLDLGEKVTPWRIQKFRKIYSYFSRYSFAIFAGLFVLFNVVYWTWLFTASAYFEWSSNEKEL